MKTRIQTTFYLIAAFSLLLISGCRENIIDPGNFVGNKNIPVQESRLNSYTFRIYAENVSFDVTNQTSFNTSSSKMVLTIEDYSSGSVTVRILNEVKSPIYQVNIEDDTDGVVKKFNGAIPDFVQIITDDFSGKLKIQISRSID